MNPAMFVCTAVERLQLDVDKYEWRATLEREAPFGKFVTTTPTPVYAPGAKYMLIIQPKGEA